MCHYVQSRYGLLIVHRLVKKNKILITIILYKTTKINKYMKNIKQYIIVLFLTKCLALLSCRHIIYNTLQYVIFHKWWHMSWYNYSLMMISE